MHVFGELWELQDPSPNCILLGDTQNSINLQDYNDIGYEFEEESESKSKKKRKKKNKKKKSKTSCGEFEEEEEIEENIRIYDNDDSREIDVQSESDTMSLISTEDLLNSKGGFFEKELRDFDSRLKKVSLSRRSNRVHLNLTPEWINKLKMMLK